MTASDEVLFRNNEAGEMGGAVYIDTDHASAEIDGATFRTNECGYYEQDAEGMDDGGAISAYNGGKLTVSRSDFSSNTARGNGGAVFQGGRCFSPLFSPAPSCAHLTTYHPPPTLVRPPDHTPPAAHTHPRVRI